MALPILKAGNSCAFDSRFYESADRLLRILRYCARMAFKMESRTQEWFDLAIERGLHENLRSPETWETKFRVGARR